MILAVAVVLVAEQPKFTPEQCKVLRQVGVDTRGICPQPPPKKTSRVRTR
jgi:hypothetical protein